MADDASPRRRLLAVLAVGLVPWTVVLVREPTFVFSFGLVSLDPFHLTNVYEFLFVYTEVLPRRLQAWPAGLLLYAGALASAIGGLRGYEDPRLTGGLLAFAGIAHAQVSYGLFWTYGLPVSELPVLPVGAVASWLVAWWYYWPLARQKGLAPLD
ncbi:TIGR04206 family protein [Natronomonas amylolytica]|uniref:TIGR04206 family protein n=1 Tax=Natronomonas amylolytica TaxID=3108498 RepID=UPI003008DE91